MDILHMESNIHQEKPIHEKYYQDWEELEKLRREEKILEPERKTENPKKP